VARSEAAGRRMGVMDAFIAAIAEAHEMALVTRNASDFAALLQPTINPWAEAT
jgi:predicted nucleic acid-binding protein